MIWNSKVKTDTRCAICNTHLAGYNLNYRNGKHYCEDHFEKTSPEELRANARELEKGRDIEILEKVLI